jgi:hypothetical protein
MSRSRVRFIDGGASRKNSCNSKGRPTSVVALLLAVNLFSAQLQAEESEGEWEFVLTPLFLWGMSIDGDSAIDGNALPLNLDFTDDIMENLDAVLTLHFEARKDKLLLFAEYQYVSLDPSVDASLGPVNVNADIDFVVNMAELGAGYTLSYTNATRWELLGGLRWFDHDLEVNIDGPPILPDTIKGGDDWHQGFIGGRIITAISENWRLIARGDYGYGGSDNNAWHFNAMADYRFSDWGSAFVGYRYMKIDYASNSYSYDAEQQGPMLGVSINW